MSGLLFIIGYRRHNVKCRWRNENHISISRHQLKQTGYCHCHQRYSSLSFLVTSTPLSQVTFLH